MRAILFLPALAAMSIAATAPKKAVEVTEAAKPKWVLEAPQLPATDPPKDAPIQIRFFDNQLRVSRSGTEQYISQKFKILKPEALPTASLRFVWRPSSGQLIVHSIRLFRSDGSISDMLGKSEFQIVQREESLEQSILTGLSTAIFPIPGVDVGDEVEFSATITNRDPTLGDRAFGQLQLPTIELGGAFRARLLQSDGVQLARKMSSDLDGSKVARVNTTNELVVELDNPKSANLPEGAPGRYGMARFIEFSTFKDWPDVSATFWNLYEKASELAPGSPVRAEIAKIAAKSDNQESRALAALKLVQDKIRYVYVGFGTGNYTPAAADQTWERRYADCKGKTALLIAILKELGVAAEPVLVNVSDLDGISDRLASPGLFDHVLVRATIDGKKYWLDGTQLNTPDFAYLPSPTFRTALPVRPAGAPIENVSVAPLTYPEITELVDIDATAGVDKPARITIRRIVHGNAVSQLKAGLASLSGDDLKHTLQSLLDAAGATAETEETTWAYDDPTGAISMRWTGTQKLDWEGDIASEKYFFLPGAGFTTPNELKRPKDQDQTAPWALDFPDFRCWITTVRLPTQVSGRKWDYSAKTVNRVLGGTRYFRQATIKNGFVQTIMSKLSLQPELSATEAAAMSTALADFDNEKSYIYQRKAGRDEGESDDPRSITPSSQIDWLSAGAICNPPKKK